MLEDKIQEKDLEMTSNSEATENTGEFEEISLLEDIYMLFKLCENQEDSRKQVTDLMTKLTDRMQNIQSQVSNLPGIHLSMREQHEILLQEQLRVRQKATSLIRNIQK